MINIKVKIRKIPKKQYILLTVVNPAGSKPTEVPVEVKGIGSGPSPPTISLLREVEDLTDAAGLKAAADPARAAAMRRNLVMVDARGGSVDVWQKRCCRRDRRKLYPTTTLQEFPVHNRRSRILEFNFRIRLNSPY